MSPRATAALGDGWHVGVVAEVAEETGVVLDVLGVARGRRFHTTERSPSGPRSGRAGAEHVTREGGGAAEGRSDPFHTGRMAVPAGVTYLVVAPAGIASYEVLRDRYDPAVVVLVGGGRDVVVTHAAAGPVHDAAGAFFAAAGEPATLPGFGGAPPFPVTRGGAGTPPFETARAWAVVRGETVDAAQALRYLIPYVRSRL